MLPFRILLTFFSMNHENEKLFSLFKHFPYPWKFLEILTQNKDESEGEWRNFWKISGWFLLLSDARFVPCILRNSRTFSKTKIFVLAEGRSGRRRNVTTATAAHPTAVRSHRAKSRLRTSTATMESTVATRNPRRTRCVEQREPEPVKVPTKFSFRIS